MPGSLSDITTMIPDPISMGKVEQGSEKSTSSIPLRMSRSRFEKLEQERD